MEPIAFRHDAPYAMQVFSNPPLSSLTNRQTRNQTAPQSSIAPPPSTD
jgi:hypothetical protein